MSTRSFYYHYSGGLLDNANIGLAFNKINPRSLIGFDTSDACVTHEIKQLRPTMRKRPINEIMGYNDVKNGEVAFMRYEYDINAIQKRNWRRKS